MHSSWTNALDTNKSAAVLSFDLSSAFDSVDAEILCTKLEIIGFDIQSVKWIKSYLTNRSQFIQIGNNISRTLIIARGSPQGSVLSPVLFIIFISDIDDWTEFAKMTGFADDYSATVIDSTLQGTLDKLEHDAKNILCFMASNCLFANESKTTFMIFSRKESNPPISIKVGNSNILEARKQKLLGVTFTPDLKLKEHIDTLTEKLRHRIYLLRHLSQLIPRTALKIVADGLVTSHIQYGLPLFCRIRLSDLDPKHSEQEKIQVIHNQMIRTLHSLNIKDKINMRSIRSSYNIQSINQMACKSTIMELRKSMFQNTLPHTLAEFLVSRYIETVVIYLDAFRYITTVHLGTWCHMLRFCHRYILKELFVVIHVIQYSADTDN